MRTLRCSQMDSLFSCPPSVLNPAGVLSVETSENRDAAIKGKIVHAALAEYATGGAANTTHHADVAGVTDAEVLDELDELTSYGIKAFEELKSYLPTPSAEVAVVAQIAADTELAGTLDLASPLNDSDAVFVDYKSGFEDTGYHNQMAAYAWCLWNFMGSPEDTEIVGIVVFLRYRYYRILRYNPASLRAWEHDLVHNKLGHPDHYAPGRQCKFCRHFHGCPARQQVAAGVMDVMVRGATLPADDHYKEYIRSATLLLADLTAETKGSAEVATAVEDILFFSRLAEQQVEEARQMIRQLVERVGPIPLTEGRTLQLVKTERKSLDGPKAVPVLRRRLSDQNILTAARFSLAKIESMVAKMQLRGEKQAAIRLLRQELLDVGAVLTTEYEVLREVDQEEASNGQPVPADSQSSSPATSVGSGP